MSEQLAFSGRTLAILSPRALDEVRSVISAVLLATDLVRMGCAEICCVGPNAEAVHDRVDEVVEDAGALSVVTTWHVDMREGCTYFVSAAAGRPRWLLAVVGEDGELPNLLRSMVKAP
jgi:hypothetical protein